MAIRNGVFVSTAKGCFKLSGVTAELLVSETVPDLYIGRSDKLYSAWAEKLMGLGVIEVGNMSRVPPKRLHVMVSRKTPLALRALGRLIEQGFEATETISDKSFVITDLSGLDTDVSLATVKEIIQEGGRSLSIWRRGGETFYGPISDPGATACWNCARLRLADSIDNGTNEIIEDEEGAAKIVADNTLLALRYPDVAGYGCLVAETNGEPSLLSIVPMPWCDVCGGVVDPLRVACLTHSVQLPENVRVLADPRGGVVRRLFIFQNEGLDMPAVPNCCSVEIAPFKDEWISNSSSNGEGKGATYDEAMKGAIGEGLERYAACIWHPSTLTYASFRELGDSAFDPRWLVLYDTAQYARDDFAYSRFDENKLIYWAAGEWLDSGESVELPALATYLNFPANSAERFCQTTSSGLAAAESFEDAALRALYELIERDAFMLFWLARQPAVRLDLGGCEELTRRALSEVERLGARPEVFLLDAATQYPTVVCLGLGDGKSWPGATIGLGTHANFDVALRKAVFEHGHFGPYMRKLMRNKEHDKVLKRSDVRNTLDHGLYYIHPEHIESLKFFRASSEPAVSIDDLRGRYCKESTLTACVSALLEIGIRTAAVDVTSSDVALAGMHVVRAFGVNLQPIHFGFGNERLQNPRLQARLSGVFEKTPHPIA